MKRLRVDSSNISEIGYRIDDQILEVKFTRGVIYQYYAVLPKTFCNLIFAESVGSYFNRNIAKEYKFKKIED